LIVLLCDSLLIVFIAEVLAGSQQPVEFSSVDQFYQMISFTYRFLLLL
jgi:hypothetical protein